MVLPEYSFPTRAVVNIMASKFKYNFDDNIIRNTYSVYMKYVDKIYTLAKLIDGNESFIFLYLGEPMERGSRGIFNTLIKSMENLLESNVINLIMKEISSLVTGDTYVNTGHNNGVWKISQDYRLEKFSEPVATA